MIGHLSQKREQPHLPGILHRQAERGSSMMGGWKARNGNGHVHMYEIGESMDE